MTRTGAALNAIAKERVNTIQEAFPESGLFANKKWRISPEPLALPKKIIKELNQKAYILQKVISKSIRTSRIPKLTFVIDNSFEFQQQIDNLINKITKDV